MVRLVCRCLNVKIHAKLPGLPVDRATLELQSTTNSEFFDHEPKEIALNLEGIHVEHLFLMTEQHCNPWTIHRCNNCQLVTHATRPSPDEKRVLVSSELLSDEHVIDGLMALPEYSPLFKVVVNANSENVPVAHDLAPKEVSETLQKLQTKLNSFLIVEEQAMEERIREFQEQEHSNYAKLQTKAKNDKNAIINTVLVSTYRNLSESLVDAMKESPVGSIDVTRAEDEVNSSPKDSPLRSRVSANGSSGNRKPQNQTLRGREPEAEAVVDYDDVFQFDPGFQDDPSQPPFSESDEEEHHDTDDSATEDAIPAKKSGDHGIGKFSTSVPINVPQWGRQISHQTNFDDDELDAAPKDDKSMAASIQALARSIHGDSSNVFGELPTSRTRSRVLSSQTSFHQ